MSLAQQFESALQRIIHRCDHASPPRLAVAYSGGLDSTTLLYLCSEYASRNEIALVAFHVHHGLSPHANDWERHCEQKCAALSIPFKSVHVQLDEIDGEGLEATARNRRYAALGELCKEHSVDILLTAHHQDDQAETILLQLLRGSGVAGLCGMQESHKAEQLLGSNRVLLARPLLEVSRSQLESFITANAVDIITDESNSDPRFLRNALRLKIMPSLAEYFPGYQTRLARCASHALSSLKLLEQAAESDYVNCLVRAESESQSNVRGTVLDARRLRALSDARIDQVLRFWIAAHNKKMPTTARLTEMRKQLLSAKHDAQVSVRHGDIVMRSYRHQLFISAHKDEVPDPEQFVWRGEERIEFPRFGGGLIVVPAAPSAAGIQRTWLIGRVLSIRLRQGGERMKLAANRPNRDMKSHYQTFGIPYWQRERLPFVMNGHDVIFAANIGMNGEFIAQGDDCVSLCWQENH